MAVAPGQPGVLVTSQPLTAPAQQVIWMSKPAVAGCPQGLEYLTQIDQLIVKQKVEVLEAITGWETANKYVILNSQNQQVYFAAEESGHCTRQMCGPRRGFTMHITDNMSQEVIRVTREFKCCAGCCWCASADCCAFEVKVEAPVGNVVGYVRQQKSCCAPTYSILNENREEVLSIHGPTCIFQGFFCTLCDQEFMVRSLDGQTDVGKISKQFHGLVRELLTDANYFGVSFPMDLDVKMKAVMVGAVFLIDFMFFEQPNKAMGFF